MAQALAEAGARIAIAGRDQRKIDGALESVKALSGECLGVLMDVRDEASIRGGVAQLVQRWGGIDVLVNNAGIGMRTVNPDLLRLLGWLRGGNGPQNSAPRKSAGGGGVKVNPLLRAHQAGSMASSIMRYLHRR